MPTVPAGLAAIFDHDCKTVASCTAFLTALALSPWAYHLDDDPRTIVGGTRAGDLKAHAKQFTVRVRACIAVMGVDQMWECYAEHTLHTDVLEDLQLQVDAPSDPTTPIVVEAEFLGRAIFAMLEREEAEAASDVDTLELFQDAVHRLVGHTIGRKLLPAYHCFRALV